MSFKALSILLDISESDIEEWIMEAMSNQILDAKIDQINDQIVIKTIKIKDLTKE
jgi:hypothetical protein